MKLYRVGSGISLSLQRLQRPGLVHSQPPRSFPGFSLYKFSGCPAPWWGSTCKPLWAAKKMANHKVRRPPRSESHWVWRSWEQLKNVLLENYFTELSLIFFFLSFICTMKSVPWVKSRVFFLSFFSVLICCLAFENIETFAAYFAFLDSFYCFWSRVDGRGQGCCLLLHNVHIYLALIYFPTVSSLVRHQQAQTVKKKLSKPPWG